MGGLTAPSYSSPVRIRIIDAFTDRPFAGNPAGVCLLDVSTWPDQEWMRRVAAELSHETAFARPLLDGADANWALRCHGIRGIIVAAVADKQSTYDFVSRYFAPEGGIPEDPATGSAHTALAPYWSPRLAGAASPACRPPTARAWSIPRSAATGSTSPATQSPSSTAP